MTEPTTCQKCGKVIEGSKYGIGTGYGTTPEGAKWCYDCCTVSDIEELKERKPTAVYLSGDENSVTNWPGGVLGTVTRAHGIKHNMIRGRYVAFRVKDVHGGLWFGRGQPGMICTIRPAKAQ